MRALSDLFYPLVARPRHTLEYMEVLPCQQLRPYIRCFWGSACPLSSQVTSDKTSLPAIVIPDGCMDIVVTVNHNSGSIDAVFCGLNDAPFAVAADNRTDLLSTFGIRFYFWAAALFADTSMKSALNAFVDVEQYFGGFRSQMADILLEKITLMERIGAAESYLLRRLQGSRPVNADVLNALYLIVKDKGILSLPDLCDNLAVSLRQLERLFGEAMGASPKKTADIVRFQMIWQDLLCGRSRAFSDLAYRYRFADQAHFINSFKKFAGQSPLAALQYARG